MKLQYVVFISMVLLLCFGCENTSLEKMDATQINEILSNVNENDPAFVQKGVSFDSVVTMAGTRTLDNLNERVKLRLYYFGDLVRGYYMLADRDDKNLQVYGKKVNGLWVIKCVTKLNMEEAGGYIMIRQDKTGIWSTGHYSFKTGTLAYAKQNIDYDELESW